MTEHLLKAGAENVNDVYVEKDDPASKRDYSYTRVPSLATAGSIAVENGKPHTVARADSSLTIPVREKLRLLFLLTMHSTLQLMERSTIVQKLIRAIHQLVQHLRQIHLR